MYQGAVQDLIDELGRLPGVGPKSAQRIAFYILNSPAEEMEKLSAAITTVKTKVSFCEVCGNISETPKCSICRDARRDQTQICVVEEPKDVSSIERTGSYNGRYHVLGGSINPMQGIGPERLRIRELVTRLADEEVQEVILAMDPNLEGEATATYLSRMLTPIGITVSRLASGLPVGGDLEYADEITLGRALEGRRILMTGQRATPVVPAKAPEREEILEEGEIPEEARDDAATGSAAEDTADSRPDPAPAAAESADQEEDSHRSGEDEASENTASRSASPFPQPERRYPTPRRNEKLANPWAD